MDREAKQNYILDIDIHIRYTDHTFVQLVFSSKGTSFGGLTNSLVA
jgi:hypothetical protein